ncbi:transcription repressor OFP1-like [Phalaenopsis equestris]|uniref:transcription repressor OFP1-like n=1 Tax=Phalaenopsis equestris TaxID=78828 RepID=UPI0009E57853|nr:transcription repressor OFP1-like [Phalaenopsis equestris]
MLRIAYELVPPMGNYRFKLSDMVPNAWFYKLRDMSKGIKSKSKGQHQRKNQNSFQTQQNSKTQTEALLPSRASYCFSSREEAERPNVSPLHPRASDTLFPQDSPRKSKKKSRRKPHSPTSTLISSSISSSISSGCSRSAWEEQLTPPQEEEVDALIDAICSYELGSSYSKLPELQLELPPIMTKPAKKEAEQPKVEEKKQSKSMARKSPTGIHRLRMRANSPRVVATKKVQTSRKSVTKLEKGISKSFAVVKSSTNPQKDFRDSMVEMISENNIRSSKELEELLACYLLLNANEYHDVIIKVFKKIWFDLTDISS